jgi:hypothetical protein
MEPGIETELDELNRLAIVVQLQSGSRIANKTKF